MTDRKIVVVDYGLGNLASVATAVRATGQSVEISDSPGRIRDASSLILPGVGAFPVAMRLLTRTGLGQAVKDAVGGGAKLLGICLGMQLLFETSTEFEGSEGLGLMAGQVRALVDSGKPESTAVRQTHIGWRQLSMTGAGQNHRLFDGISSGSTFYFVHSFSVHPRVSNAELAIVSYGEKKVVAACAEDRIVGVQFHPEKSGTSGLALLRNFALL